MNLENTLRNAVHKKEELFSFTPGFSRVMGGQENKKPFKRFPVLTFAQFTWLKPGVNEIEGRKNSTTSWLRRTLVQRLCQYLDHPSADKSSLMMRRVGS